MKIVALFALALIALIVTGCALCCEDCPDEPAPEPTPEPAQCVRDNPGTPGCASDTGVQCGAEQIPAMCSPESDLGTVAQCTQVGRCADDSNVSLYCCPIVLTTP